MSDEAEKAWAEWREETRPPMPRLARLDFMAGRASRDAEVAELRERWQEVVNAPGFDEAVEVHARHYHDSACGYQREVESLRQQLATRDAEVTAYQSQLGKYQSQLGKSFDEYESLRQQLAAREAVIARVRAYAEDRAFHARGHLNTVNSGRIASDLQAILATSPVSVLADGYTVELGGQTFSKAQWDAVQTYAKGTSSPTEYRKGAGQ